MGGVIYLDILSCNPSIKAKYSKDPKVVDLPFEEDGDVIHERERFLILLKN